MNIISVMSIIIYPRATVKSVRVNLVNKSSLEYNQTSNAIAMQFKDGNGGVAKVW